MKFPRRSLATAVCAMAATTGLLMTTSLDLPVQLSSTVLVMGGNSNPQGVEMDRQLNGYFSTEEGTPYSGYDYTVVPWSAQIPLTGGANGMTYDASQAEGLSTIRGAVDSHYETGDPLVVVGYSSSAAVVTKLLRQLQADHAAGKTTPSSEDLSVVLLGNPNRPNGGVLARFPGMYVGAPVGMTFDGATPQTDYTVTDISWQYDGIADFPNYTSNLLAVANAMLGFLTLHGQYYGVDPTDPRQVLSDVQVGNTRYITLRGDLPLLAPFYLLGVPRPLLAGLDAALRAEIERGYDRTIRPDIATPAQSRATTTTTPRVETSGVPESTLTIADRAAKKVSARIVDEADGDDADSSDDDATSTDASTTASTSTSPSSSSSVSTPTGSSPTGTSPTGSSPSESDPADGPVKSTTAPTTARTPTTKAAA